MIVPRYGIFEETFDWNSAGCHNPWQQVHVTITLTPPTKQRITVGGFYYGPNTWKARFAPDEIGKWSWQAVLTDGAQTARFAGTFQVVKSDWPGFVRQNPNNKFRWVFDDGSPFYPLGIGDCMQDLDKSGSPIDNWGLDGDFRPPTPDEGRLVDIDTYWKAYSEAGVNLFRWSVDNCAFGLYRSIEPGGNVYLRDEGIAGDELVQKLRQYGARTYMVIFGFEPPFPQNTTREQFDAINHYVKYVVDRYGAYVDFWELMNEATVSDDWYHEVASYLRSIDPYKHPISTSWEKPELDAIEINSPHWYQKENEFDSDEVTWQKFEQWKRAGKPVIVGEQGNSGQNFDERSGLRMRLRAWTTFFAEGALIFWNNSFAKDYKAGAANIYLGPEERGYLKVLQDFTRGFDARAQITTLQVSNPNLVRGYALSSPTTYATYLHAYTDHANPTTGISVTLESPAAGTATWIEPATGRVLGSQAIAAGTQVLTVPPFTIDIALKITTANA